MNKIYKVVWSKVKNCYVVVSEIAKNVISGSVKSAKVGTAPLVKGAALGAMMAFVITGNVWAALEGGVARPTDDIIYDTKDSNKASLNTSNNIITFSGNIHGGVLYVDSGKDVTVKNSTFTGNSMSVENPSGKDNQAAIKGGTIYTEGNLIIDGCTFNGTVATSGSESQTHGTEIYINGGKTLISGTSFNVPSHSTAPSGGNNGAVYINTGTLELNDVKFTGNGKGNLLVIGANANENNIIISGTKNEFNGGYSKGILNDNDNGVLTFAEGSVTSFTGGGDQINSYYGGTVNIEKNAVVNMSSGIKDHNSGGIVNIKGGTLNGNIYESNTVNINGGTLNGTTTSSNIMTMSNGTWKLTGNSGTKGITIKKDDDSENSIINLGQYTLTGQISTEFGAESVLDFTNGGVWKVSGSSNKVSTLKGKDITINVDKVQGYLVNVTNPTTTDQTVTLNVVGSNDLGVDIKSGVKNLSTKTVYSGNNSLVDVMNFTKTNLQAAVSAKVNDSGVVDEVTTTIKPGDKFVVESDVEVTGDVKATDFVVGTGDDAIYLTEVAQGVNTNTDDIATIKEDYLKAVDKAEAIATAAEDATAKANGAVNEAAKYTNQKYEDAKAYANEKKAEAVNEAVNQSAAYTNQKYEDGKAYTDAAKADSVNEAAKYTNQKYEDAVVYANEKKTEAVNEAVNQSAQYTNQKYEEGKAYTDAAKADAVNEAAKYTNQKYEDAVAYANEKKTEAVNEAVEQAASYTNQKYNDAIAYVDEKGIALEGEIANVKANIEAEAVARANKDADLEQAIVKEANTRYTEDERLQKNINANKTAIETEIAERAAKDVAIEQALSTEANTRYTEDERLQKNINANKDAIEAEAATRQAQVDGINQRLGKMNGKINKVGAGAAALAALHPLEYDPDDKLTFAAGVGNYAGENAAALGAFYRPDEKLMFSLGGTMGNGENMVNLGVSIGLDGASGTPKLSKKELVQKVNTMEAENANMKAEIAELKALVAELAKKK